MEQQSVQIRDITGEVYQNVVHFPDPLFGESFMNNIDSGDINMSFSTKSITYDKEDFVNAIKKYMFDSGVEFKSRQAIEAEQNWQQGDPTVLFYDTRNFPSALLRDLYGRTSYNFSYIASDAQYAEMLIYVPVFLRRLYAEGFVLPFPDGPRPGTVSYRIKGQDISETARVKVLAGIRQPKNGLTVNDYHLKLFVPASPLLTANVTFNIGPLRERRVFNLPSSQSESTEEESAEQSTEQTTSRVSNRNRRSITGGRGRTNTSTTRARSRSGSRNGSQTQTSPRQSSGRTRQSSGRTRQSSGRTRRQNQDQTEETQQPPTTTTRGRGRRQTSARQQSAPRSQSPQQRQQQSPRSGSGEGTVQTQRVVPPQVTGTGRRTRARTRVPAPVVEQPAQELVDIGVANNGSVQINVTPTGSRNASPRVSPRVNGNASPRVNGNISPRSNGNASPRVSPRSNGNASPRSNGNRSPRRNNGNGLNVNGTPSRMSPRRSIVNGSPFGLDDLFASPNNENQLLNDLNRPINELFGDDEF